MSIQLLDTLLFWSQKGERNMGYLKEKAFWEAATKRAIRTGAQGVLTTIGTTTMYFHEVNWKLTLSAALLAMILSYATSIVTGLPEVEE